MKKTIIGMVAILILTGSLFSSCNRSTSKSEDAQKSVKDARQDLTEAKQDLYQARKDSILQFKKDSQEKITANEKEIAAFRAKLKSEKKEDQEKYEKKLAWLETKNTAMKQKLTDYSDEGQEKWTSFKNEFNHDMDDFGKSFKDLMTDNVK